MQNNTNSVRTNIKDIRLEITEDENKPVAKTVPHSRIFFETPGYQQLTQESKTPQNQKTQAPQPLAFSAFGWCFSLLATGMIVFVLGLLLFLIYEAISRQGIKPRNLKTKSEIKMLMFE